MQKLETTLLVSLDQGCAEKEWPRLVVEYRHVNAYSGFVRGEPINPPEPEHVEIGQVYVLTEEPITNGFADKQTFIARHPLPEWMVEPLTEQLEAMCLDHWRGKRDEALERRAEERRDDAMAERTWSNPRAAE